MNDYDWCPVCRRYVSVSVLERVVHGHRDKIGTTCPMSGRMLPADDLRKKATA